MKNVWNATAKSLLGLTMALAPATMQADDHYDDDPIAQCVLEVEFDDGVRGEFGRILASEQADGSLLFEASLAPAVLGSRADLHRLYFNLAGDFTGVGVDTLDDVRTLYVLQTEPSVAGGAGSAFDYGVNLGNGSGKKGNGVLQNASFELFADVDLHIADLLVTSETNQGIASQMAVHVQNTELVDDSDSETLGCVFERTSDDVDPG